MTRSFDVELSQWGPEAFRRRTDAAARTGSAMPPSLAEAEAYCRRLARSHYENFPLASWMLPRRLHQHFFHVYAYCRWSDDLADEVPGTAESLELLDWWKAELRACYAGTTRHPVFVALRTTIEEFDIPAEPFEDLISAFEQDQRVTEYATFAELRDYCRRSADPVGRLVLFLCRQHTPENVAWSDSICTGLQLANFWQDVSRDLSLGRIYLPREDRERFGYSEDELHARTTNAAFLELMRFEVDRARDFLIRGLPLVPRMPGRMQVDIELFARGGLKILERIEAIGYRVWERRPEVTKRDAAKLFLQCAKNSVWRMLTRSARRTRRAKLEMETQGPAS